MLSRAEMLPDGTIRREELLGLSCRFEPLHPPLIMSHTPTDIFPNIDIPVIAVAWQFAGLNPEELEGRLTTGFERILTTTVDNIEHIESTTVNGQAIVKIFR
jgi:Cu/Ag efflux pump CusA